MKRIRQESDVGFRTFTLILNADSGFILCMLETMNIKKVKSTRFSRFVSCAYYLGVLIVDVVVKFAGLEMVHF